MLNIRHLSIEELEAGLDHIRRSPKDEGRVMLIVRRPDSDERETLEQCTVDSTEGLVGDNWKVRGNPHTPDGSAKINAQITIMNVRAIALLAQSEDRWSLAGDQLYVDIDLSDDNLPAGTRLTLGTAVLEVTPEPHTGCKKFAERYGTDATKFVNSAEGKRLHLRGINSRVIQAGEIRLGDVVRKS
jgi:MOSC domain-containing protein YiiM